MHTAFPTRVYTEEEVKRANDLINNGYRHHLRVEGSQHFQQKVKRATELIKAAGYWDFFTAYIRAIKETDGLTMLHNASAAIWANRYAVANPVDAASIFIQKAARMQEYLQLQHYYSGEAEKRSVQKRIDFLDALREKSQEKEVIEECERLLRFWRESSLVY